MSHRVQLSWVGGEHTFALGIGQLRAIQKVCDAGPEAIIKRNISGDWKFDDLYEVIRQGLIGSGEMDETEASKYVTQMLEQHPLLRFKTLSLAILSAALTGEGDDKPGKPDGTTVPTENGTSESSSKPGS